MFGMGSGEFILVVFVMLLVFGPKNIIEIARFLGETLKKLRKAINEIKYSLESAANIEEKKNE